MRLFFVSVCVLFSCGGTVNHEQSKMIFKYNESAGIHSFDPAFAKDQSRIWFCNQIYNSLVQLDSNLQVQPSISKRWEISENGLQYDFIIRDNVAFHHSEKIFGTNGRSVDVNDVIYSLNRLKSKKIASPGAWILSNVKNISVFNDSTVRVHLLSPNPAFLGLLSMQYCSVLPVESDTIPDFFDTPLGTGPFQFQYHKPNVKLSLIHI